MNLNTIETMQKSITADKRAYSIEEISRQTSLSKAYLRQKEKSGELIGTRFGRRILILAENLEEFLKRGSK